MSRITLCGTNDSLSIEIFAHTLILMLDGIQWLNILAHTHAGCPGIADISAKLSTRRDHIY